MLISLIYSVSEITIKSTGRGGPGGKGGSGCSWTGTTYVRNWEGQSVPRTVTHYEPGKFFKVASILLFQHIDLISLILGGTDGPSGSSGRRPTHLLYDGMPGDSGKFQFLIRDRY